MQRKKGQVGFEQLNDISIAAAPLDKESPKRAEVVGSNPTRSIFSCCTNTALN
jgi:hypothetical protein